MPFSQAERQRVVPEVPEGVQQGHGQAGVPTDAVHRDRDGPSAVPGREPAPREEQRHHVLASA